MLVIVSYRLYELHGKHKYIEHVHLLTSHHHSVNF